jgi:hypothetical protein
MANKKRGFINPKNEPLTIEKLREMTGENYNDEEAQEIVLQDRKRFDVSYRTAYIRHNYYA